jgi:rhamnulokinase
MNTSFLAFDLGAESGRAFLGLLQEERLLLDELDRFPNEMVRVSKHLHWDVHALFIRIKKAISLCLREAALSPSSIGIDTWGVDFALLDGIPVIATGSHDTASAVAAVPAEGDDWAYISSGTWSLMGVETTEPVITADSMRFNFTNEGGVCGTFRFLKNVMGLWLLQQCREVWAGERAYLYEELAGMAGETEPFQAILDPDYEEFLNPPSMPEAIARYFRETGQDEPRGHAGIVRVILEGLALRYREVLEQLRKIRAQPINRIHVVGGGSRNRLLCQFTADATGLPVTAGPVEATAAGNVLVQAMGLGFLSSLEDIRRVTRSSFELESYTPARTAEWDPAYERFLDVKKRTGV